MGWVSGAIVAIKAFLAGLKLARRAKAAAEVDRGEAEVRTSRDSVARIEAELR